MTNLHQLPTPELRLRPTHDLCVPVEPTVMVRLSIDDRTIAWGATAVEWDAITAVRYGTRSESTSLFQQRRVRRVGIQTPQGVVDLCLGRTDLGADAEQRQIEAYYAVIDRLHDHVEPRLRAAAFARIDSHGRFDIGKLSVVPAGLLVPGRLSRKLVTWDQLPAAHFENDRVAVTGGVGNATKILGDISMLETNAVLLPEICIEGIHRYG